MRFRGHYPIQHQDTNVSPHRSSPTARRSSSTAIRPTYAWWPTTTTTTAAPIQINNSPSTASTKETSNGLQPQIHCAPPLYTATFTASLNSSSCDWNSTAPLNTPAADLERYLPSMSTLTVADDAIPKLALREISLGTLVGQGGFSDVKGITAVDLEDVFDTSEEDAKIRRKFASAANYKGSNQKKFVLKTLRTDLPEEEHTKGVLDLAIEADMLATLRHENIISLRAIANSDPHESRFFVVLDRLGVTLERKFNQWRKIASDATGFYFPCYGYCCSKTHLLHNLWKERLEVAYQTAQAVEYLHANGIVYRDLKPDNIGFDADTHVVKLFDFGLAKRLRDAEKAHENGHPAFSGLYHLTGNTGSLRYMAPEVAKCLPYDQTVDAYSFGILFWQICSLITPYAKYSTKTHAERVVRQGHRPKPDASWPLTWVQLQQSCWSSDKSFRPPFSEIVVTLQGQLELLAEEDGVVPNRAFEIRAKKKQKKVKSQSLDVDTRNTSVIMASSDAPEGLKRFDKDVV